jgi:hypothetical protein
MIVSWSTEIEERFSKTRGESHGLDERVEVARRAQVVQASEERLIAPTWRALELLHT